MRAMRRLTCGAMALIVWLTLASGADAAPLTIGDPLLGAQSTSPSGVAATLLNITIAEPGAVPTSPVSGLIVRWHLIKASGGPFRLRVLRPAGGSSYTAVGTSAAATAATPNLETFATALPIRAGDTIGLDVVKGLEVGAIPNPASVLAAITPIMIEGSTAPLTATGVGAEFAFNAEVQPAPTVTSVSPTTGSFTGGSPVTISGTDFAGVSGVSFGGVAAKSFTVASESELTAVAPTAERTGPVDVTVSTIAGTSAVTTADRFTYAACVVPKLKNKNLGTAKKKLRKAGCRVGKVTRRGGATAKTGRVVNQGKKAGRQLAPGTKVNIALG